MQRHLWTWGIVGAVMTAAFGLFGMNVVPQASLGCLASLLIPLLIGYMAARASIAAHTQTSVAQGAINGGIAAGLAAVLGGTANVLMGCMGDPGQFTTGGLSALLALSLSGIVVLAIVYFVQGCIVGVVAISLRGVVRSR
jgi:hypothetical protein